MIIIHHYGAFRQYGEKTELNIALPATIAAIQAALVGQWGKEGGELAEYAVLADDRNILPADYIIDKDCVLSILPPVCGG